MEVKSEVRRCTRKSGPDSRKSFLQKFEDCKENRYKRPERSFSNVSNISTNSSFSRRGRGSNTSQNYSRPFHVNADPNITLRQTQERLSMKDLKDWSNMSDLGDTEEADLAKYKAKMLRKKSQKSDMFPLEIEEDIAKLVKRQRDIDKVKVEQAYRDYLYQMPKETRDKGMPVTPCKFRVMSRRGWDSRVQRWKKHLHHWKEADYEPSVSSVSRLSTSEFDLEVSSIESGPTTPVKPAEVTASWTVSSTVLRQEINFLDEDTNTMLQEESTLQGFRTSSPIRKTAKRSSVIAKLDVDEKNNFATLVDEEANAHFPIMKTRAQHRSLRNSQEDISTEKLSKVEPDVLHSGLTNEMQSFANWAKRPHGRSRPANKDTTAEENFGQSPKKKIRRNSNSGT